MNSFPITLDKSTLAPISQASTVTLDKSTLRPLASDPNAPTVSQHPNTMSQYFQDMRDDLLSGTDGTLLGKMAKWLNPRGMGAVPGHDVLGGIVLGPPEIAQGIATAAEGHPIKGAAQVVRGVAKTVALPAAVLAPEATAMSLPRAALGVGVQAGSQALGASEDTSTVLGAAAGLAGPNIAKAAVQGAANYTPTGNIPKLALKTVTGMVPGAKLFSATRSPTLSEWLQALKPDAQMSLYKSMPKLGDTPVSLETHPATAELIQQAATTPSYFTTGATPKTNVPLTKFSARTPLLQDMRDFEFMNRAVNEMNAQVGEGQYDILDAMQKAGGSWRGKESAGADVPAARAATYLKTARDSLPPSVPDAAIAAKAAHLKYQDEHLADLLQQSIQMATARK